MSSWRWSLAWFFYCIAIMFIDIAAGLPWLSFLAAFSAGFHLSDVMGDPKLGDWAKRLSTHRSSE